MSAIRCRFAGQCGLALGMALALSLPATAQVTQQVVQSRAPEGTLWFRSFVSGGAAGSAQLAALDTQEPPTGLGLQAIWLEWNQTNVYATGLGGGVLTDEVLTPPPASVPLAGVRGVATLNGGFVETFDSGVLTGVVPEVGSFLWTADRLYVVGIGGGIARAEVTAPGGGSIANVLGVALIESGLFDFDPAPETVEPHVLGAALVYTPTRLYHVGVDLAGGVTFATVEINRPASAGGGPLAGVRGVSVISSTFVPPTVPPTTIMGTVMVWTGGQVFVVTRTPALDIQVLPTVPEGDIWGVMRIAQGSTPFRGAALVWKRNQLYLVGFTPAVGVVEVTTPTPAPGPIVSDVRLESLPTSKLDQQLRQAGALYESRGFVGPDAGVPGLIIGQDQRARFP